MSYNDILVGFGLNEGVGSLKLYSFLSACSSARIERLHYNRRMNAAIFLDRDGVIIENREQYVRSWEDVCFLDGAKASLALLATTPYRIVIVTNQSAIGRGILTAEAVDEMNQRLVREIRVAGGRVDAVYVCPHAPDIACDCRKPRPGLLLKAAVELDLNLAQSYMVGDALSDVEAGLAAGVKSSLIVCTGRGAAQLQMPEAAHIHPLVVFPSLTEVTRAIQDHQV